MRTFSGHVAPSTRRSERSSRSRAVSAATSASPCSVKASTSRVGPYRIKQRERKTCRWSNSSATACRVSPRAPCSFACVSMRAAPLRISSR